MCIGRADTICPTSCQLDRSSSSGTIACCTSCLAERGHNSIPVAKGMCPVGLLASCFLLIACNRKLLSWGNTQVCSACSAAHPAQSCWKRHAGRCQDRLAMPCHAMPYHGSTQVRRWKRVPTAEGPQPTFSPCRQQSAQRLLKQQAITRHRAEYCSSCHALVSDMHQHHHQQAPQQRSCMPAASISRPLWMADPAASHGHRVQASTCNALLPEVDAMTCLPCDTRRPWQLLRMVCMPRATPCYLGAALHTNVTGGSSDL